MRRYWPKLWYSKGGGGTLSENFRGKGVSSSNDSWHKKTGPWAIIWRCLHDCTFSGFDTIPVCDRQTDRHTTMANTRASIASHG